MSMRIPRIYQSFALNQGDTISLDQQAATHVTRVLRLKQDDSIIVFNGDGNEYLGCIENVDRRSARVRLLELRQAQLESPLQISLIQGVSRSERMDYTLQKSVELGVSNFYPVLTQHTSVHLDEDRKQKKRQHWQGVVISACEQCGRNVIPAVNVVTDLTSCIQSFEAETCLKVVLDHRAPSLLKQLECPSRRAVIIVGPEGGLSDPEMEYLKTNGFIGVSLGPRVLRTETAAVAAIAVMQSLWGDFL